MQTFSDVIDAFPGPTAERPKGALAEHLGVSKGLVAVWKHRKRIPSQYWAAVVDAAKAEKKPTLKPITLALLAKIETERASERKGQRVAA